MREPDAFDRLARDLRALPRRERRAVLDDLSQGERARLAALLAGAAPEPEPRPSSDDGLELLSPWLRARLSDGDAPGPGEPQGRWKMTASTRLLLRQSVRNLLDRRAAAARQGPARRSLAGAVGDLLFRKESRP